MSMEKVPGPINEAVFATVRTVAQDVRMQKALAIAKDRAEEAMALQVHISEIPAPTFEERTRAEEIVRLMKAAGLEDVSIDGGKISNAKFDDEDARQAATEVMTGINWNF